MKCSPDPECSSAADMALDGIVDNANHDVSPHVTKGRNNDDNDEYKYNNGNFCFRPPPPHAATAVIVHDHVVGGCRRPLQSGLQRRGEEERCAVGR